MDNFLVSCQHDRMPIKVGEKTIYASSYFQGKSVKEDVDLFIALDDAWFDKLTDTIAMGKDLEATPFVPFIYVDWRDYSDNVNPKHLAYALLEAQKYLNTNKIVEVSCYGGHGRTGTFIAMLLCIMEELHPYIAIWRVKDEYCKKAIESKSQIELLYKLFGDGEKEAKKDFPEFYSAKTTWKYKNGKWIEDKKEAVVEDDIGYLCPQADDCPRIACPHRVEHTPSEEFCTRYNYDPCFCMIPEGYGEYWKYW